MIALTPPPPRLPRRRHSYFEEMGCHVLEIHSRKSQGARLTASKAFLTGTNVVLFSSDVSARGMDYPDISLVVQARCARACASVRACVMSRAYVCVCERVCVRACVLVCACIVACVGAEARGVGGRRLG